MPSSWTRQSSLAATKANQSDHLVFSLFGFPFLVRVTTLFFGVSLFWFPSLVIAPVFPFWVPICGSPRR